MAAEVSHVRSHGKHCVCKLSVYATQSLRLSFAFTDSQSVHVHEDHHFTFQPAVNAVYLTIEHQRCRRPLTYHNSSSIYAINVNQPILSQRKAALLQHAILHVNQSKVLHNRTVLLFCRTESAVLSKLSKNFTIVNCCILTQSCFSLFQNPMELHYLRKRLE